jgi:hypothetical protein
VKYTVVVAILLCTLSFGLGGCATEPEHVDMIAEGDSSFMVYCAPSACRKKATARCQSQGFSRYDVVEEIAGDERGDASGVVIQCKK